jgi:hypothetical protein
VLYSEVIGMLMVYVDDVALLFSQTLYKCFG